MDIDLVKQAEIISQINDLFTTRIQCCSDLGGTHIVFVTNNHNIVVGDRITIYNIMNDDNVITDFNEYNPSPGRLQYDVIAITDDTFTVAGIYNADYVVESSYAKTVKVFNNELQTLFEPNISDFPLVIVDVRDTDVKEVASNRYVPQETIFPFKVMDAVENYSGGVNTKILACRTFVSNKFVAIMDELELEIENDITKRYEDEYGREVSVKSCVLIK